MSMRTRLAIVMAAFVAVMGSATPAGATTGCQPPGARTMAHNSRVDVYGLNGSVYACDVRTGKRVRLGKTHICIESVCVNRAAVAGDLVAYGSERCGVDTCSAAVYVLRVSDDKQLRSYAAITGSIGAEFFQSVTALVVKRDGAVAWIATDKSIIGHGTLIEVHANGKLLDSGAGIATGSLRLHGSTLTWRDGGATRSATL